MNILGISGGFHDASVSVIDQQGNILFAGHSERYSKKKNDEHLCPAIMAEISQFDISKIAYYERPWLKQLRRLRSGETIQWNRLTVEQCLRQELGNT